MPAPLVVALLALLALATAGLIVAETRGSKRGQWVFKPLASACFVAIPFAGGGPVGLEGALIEAALVLAFLGDFCLIPDDARVFRVGIVLFLAAHLAFGAAFVVPGLDAARFTGAVVLTTVAGILLARWILPRVPRALKPAVGAYMVVISVMLVLAVATTRSALWAGGAALAFYLSDVTVARHRFVAREPLNRVVGLPLYYGAQAALALLALS